MGLLRDLAFVLYQLPSGWKKDADRRLNLSCIIAVVFIINLISARAFAQYLITSGDHPGSVMPPEPIWLLIVAAVFVVFYRLVLTPEAYKAIKWRSATDPMSRAKARLYAWICVALTIVAYIGALILAAQQ